VTGEVESLVRSSPEIGGHAFSLDEALGPGGWSQKKKRNRMTSPHSGGHHRGPPAEDFTVNSVIDLKNWPLGDPSSIWTGGI
jgi:hypothetical protein